MKVLMTGNEALARGAWEAGVTVAAAYPGTPSTEIIENMARYPEVYTEWAPNEKVAAEVGLGAAIGGARALVAMKHVGLNVAADPLFTLVYTGINGGFVLVCADDPGMHSSQNEQDNRNYARFAKLPLLEPADSQEARDFMVAAFALSEKFDTPVMVRMTTRVAHGQSVVELKDRLETPLRPYTKNISKFVMLPANARMRHPAVEKRLQDLAEYVEKSPLNTVCPGNDRQVGIIASGACYQYVREVLPDTPILKLGTVFPLPKKLIESFAREVGEVIVVEELDPFIEEHLRVWGLPARGKEVFSRCGELGPEIIAEKLLPLVKGLPANNGSLITQDDEVPGRPPVMCPGCPHRGVFYVLKKRNFVVTGDIGCYTLGASPPLAAMDTCICMGASIGAALGMEKARGQEFAQKMVAVIGDSTFLHSGVTGLMDVVYNRGTTTVIILDNGTTAMTGHQEHPGTGTTVKKEPTHQVDLEMLARSLGVGRVRVVDPYQMDMLEKTLLEEAAAAEPSVLIARRPCVLLTKEPSSVYTVHSDECNECGRCRRLACPALSFRSGKTPAIDANQCTGCSLCAQLCRKQAIVKAGEEHA